MTDVLVAGIGNIFFRDDGYGPAVVAALARIRLPGSVRVVDYGIRGVHLTYDLLDGVDALVLVDAVPATVHHRAGDPAGTVVTMRIGADDLGGAQFDAHGMSPAAVLGSLAALGGELPPTWLVGCVPADLDEGIGLSAVVEAALAPSVAALRDLLADLAAEPAVHGVAAAGG